MPTALVTGASSGMGEATVKKLLEKDFTVYAAARRVERMNGLEELGATALKLDITKEEDIQAAVDRITAEQGGVDVLINNAGFGLYGPVEDVPLEDARRQFEVNLFGLARLTQLVLPYMREQRSGRIINTSSMGGKIFTPLGAWYHATKHALEGWSDCLRYELRPFNVKVVIIEPGGVRTEWGDIVGKQLREYYDKSAYQTQMDPFIKLMEDPRTMERGTAPEVLADVFVKAATTRNPRRRYVKGSGARPLMFVRRWLGDGAYEFMLRRAFR